MDNYNIYRQNPPAGGNANKLVFFFMDMVQMEKI